MPTTMPFVTRTLRWMHTVAAPRPVRMTVVDVLKPSPVAGLPKGRRPHSGLA